MKLKILFLSIIVLASILRIIALDKFPAGFNADEAAIGYNAYSLLQTGKDEYGAPWPLTFKSFGDYKPGLYFYFVLPFVAMLGLNEWAVRLPSVILGIMTVVLVYFLAKEIFSSRRVGLLVSFILATSPWHLQFSRGGWETNAATFFITLGIYLFLKGQSKLVLLAFSLVSFLASMYLYQSPRLVVPVLLTLLIYLYRKNFIRLLKSEKLQKISFCFFILVILSIPLLLQFTSGEGTARFSGLSFLSDTGPAARVNELRGEHQDLNGFVPKILHNKLTAYSYSFLSHYLDHFTGNFLFINGDPLIRNKVPETGQFYLIEGLLLIIGLISLANSNFIHRKLIISWLVVAPLASSITYQTPHALRALNMVIPMSLIIGFGLNQLIGDYKKIWRKVVIIVMILVFLFEIVHYLESYYIHSPKRYPLAWEHGFKEMVVKLNEYKSDYSRIVITDRYDQPYILVLFYQKYDPKSYQPQAKLTERDKFNFGTVRGFDNLEFHSIKKEDFQKGTLLVGTEEEIPSGSKIIDKLNFPNGKPAFIFAEGDK